MRPRLLPWIAAALVALLWFAGFGATPHARAEGDHDSQGMIVLDDLSIEQRQLAMKVWSVVICNCPRENWSKSLLNCPDGCADKQKQEILHRVEEGWDATAIYDEQKQMYGPRAIGKPDDVLTYLLPALVMVISGVVVALVFGKWRRETAARRAGRNDSVHAETDEVAAIEAELREMR